MVAIGEVALIATTENRRSHRLKKCSKCKIQKDFSEYSRSKAEPCGLYHQCKDCKKQYRKGYMERNKALVYEKEKVYRAKTAERRKANQVAYYADNKDRMKEQAKLKYQREREAIREKRKEHYWKNRDAHLAVKKEYLAKNLHVVMARNAARRALHMHRKPKWLTRQDIKDMREIYRTAQVFQELTGEKYHVDHIYPLLGEFVSGLHVPGNLQILPAKENMQKKNRYTPE